STTADTAAPGALDILMFRRVRSSHPARHYDASVLLLVREDILECDRVGRTPDQSSRRTPSCSCPVRRATSEGTSIPRARKTSNEARASPAARHASNPFSTTRDRPRTVHRGLLAGHTPVVHRDHAVSERRRRDELEPTRAEQPTLVERRAVACDPRVDEEPILIDQIQPIQRGRQLAATEKHAGRGRVLELLHARAQVPVEV